MGGVVLLSIIFQSTFFMIYNLNNPPDIPLLFIVNTSLMTGHVTGGIFGLLFGLIQDIVYGDLVGIHALSWMLIGIGVGITSKNLFKSNWVVIVAITVFTTLFNHLIVFLMFTLFSLPISFHSVINSAALTSLVNAFMAIPVHLLVKKVIAT